MTAPTPSAPATNAPATNAPATNAPAIGAAGASDPAAHSGTDAAHAAVTPKVLSARAHPEHTGNGAEAPHDPANTTYLIIDGENIDATLGLSVLGRRPNPDERPRWERVRDHLGDLWGQPVSALFFLNASSGSLPSTFIAALLAMGYRPVPLSGHAGEKVVDIGIQRTLEAIAKRPGDVILGSHDGDFLPQVQSLLGAGRRVGMLAFREYLNSGFVELEAEGLQILDLELDVRAFNAPLPRVRIIPIEEFDPLVFL